MSKLQVIDEQQHSKVPFLRGMLTRSLKNAGLNFADAYQLATDIRDSIDGAEVISTGDLRARTIDALIAHHPKAVLRRYRREDLYPGTFHVVYNDNHSAPFSRGTLAQRLESCSLPRDKCNKIATRIHNRLLKDKTARISTDELTSLTYRTIDQELGDEDAAHYLIWNDFIDNDQPLLVLIGGVPGTGKSTVATELANSLGIVRTQSTDMLREVMRTLIPKRVSPLLHTSSFNAGGAVDTTDIYTIRDEENLRYGFQRQTELVEVACEAVLRRALNERVSMILEGVHIRPTLLSHIADDDAVVVMFTLCVLDKNSWASRIKRRKVQTRQRRAARYLEKIDDIWQLQSALLSESDSADIQILNNTDGFETAREIIKTITQTIAATYSKARIAALKKKYR